MKNPVAWAIAGSDSSGGAGITSDILTFNHLNVHGCAIISAVTAQNSQNVSSIHHIPAAYLCEQFNALKQSYQPAAIKIGMLGNHEVINVLKAFLESYSGEVVLDPVLSSSSGQHLFDSDSESYINNLIMLFPYIDLLTPNVPEAEKILKIKIQSHDDVVAAANKILTLGVNSVVIKAGHFENDINCKDYWTNGETSFWLSSPRQTHKNYRGSGCVFSSAVTASLALGYDMKDALVIAKMYINRGIRLAQHHTDEAAILHHASFPDALQDVPDVMDTLEQVSHEAFHSCGSQALGLYPVVDDANWLATLLPLGVNTIQLRIKNKNGMELENEIKQAIQLANQYNARLFINDYWELAIAHGAYGVHLGQEDLTNADIRKIHAAGLRLGISTHCFYEVARAHAYRPSYMACGPIYPTTSKIMPFHPQGISNLHYWRRLLNDYKLVAIGGINEENIMNVVDTNVDGIAMISAITHALNPQQKTQTLLNMMAG